MRTRSLTLMMLAGFLSVVDCKSAHAVAGPPLVTDDPGTPGPNNWEINVAFTSESSKEEKRVELPFLDLNYGLGERIQLKYEVPYVISKNEEQDSKNSGIDRSTAGVKWRFRDKKKTEGEAKPEGFEKVEGGEDGGVALSTYPQYTFKSPVAESVRLAEGTTSHEFFLPVEAEETFGKWDFNQELGYRWLEQNTSLFAAGFALTYNIKEDTALVLGEPTSTTSTLRYVVTVPDDIWAVHSSSPKSKISFSVCITFQPAPTFCVLTPAGDPSFTTSLGGRGLLRSGGRVLNGRWGQAGVFMPESCA